MKKLFFALLAILAFAAPAYSTDVQIGASTIPGFNAANLPPDVAVSPVSVVNGSPVVTCSNCFRSQWVGLGGFRVTINAVPYTVAYVTSRSSLTLTTNYAAGDSSAATILWYKYVELRIYADSSFQPLGKTYIVQPGAPGSGAWHRRVAASVVNELGINNLYIPQLTLDATTDSLTNQAARYTAAFYRPEGSLIQFYDCFESFLLAPTGATTWPDICMFNTRQVIVQDDSTYTKTQVDSFRTGCTTGQGLFYASTGLKPACLNFGSGLSLAGDTLTAVAPSGYTTVLNNGTPLTQRNNLNFVGPALVSVDNGGAVRTDVTLDADLNTLAGLTGTGFAQRTGVNTWALNADVVTGPASATDNAIARFDLTTGKLIQNSAVTVADTTGAFSVPNGWSVTNVAGGSIVLQNNELTFTSPAFGATTNGYTFFQGTQTQSSGIVRTFAVNGTYNQTGTAASTSLSLFRTETALGSGEHNFIEGFGGAAGATKRFRISNNGNYFFGATGGFIGDEGGNEYLKFSTVASAVNEITIANAATGGRPTISTTGDNANVGLGLAAKGTADIASFSNFIVAKDAAEIAVSNTTSAKTLTIAVQNDSNAVFYRQGASPTAAVDMTTGVWSFVSIPILPGVNPTTANQAARKQFVDDTTTAFSACWFYAALPGAVETTESVGRWVVPVGQDITVTSVTGVWAAGADSGASNVFTIKRRNSSGTLQSDVGTVDINAPAQNALQSGAVSVALAAGDQLYSLFTTRNTASETLVTVCVRGTQKRIP